ncbi:hypothetical protein MIB92_08390 [Aestuariirhabdus sp. Z084]|uniref:hypothetical protein n=1 Tax=Aestuariirhabdus haliotis TaxID=2918751 RepID=UPI00201B3863|nr:hypothetical protein [Aestuariirhabdus haliotis]MCL6415667.1 hypothetical protein [Aestuariirhabdus haliotis]MCL6419807.1 hypothetical protein [Aestuariirhabdus haliotis]
MSRLLAVVMMFLAMDAYSYQGCDKLATGYEAGYTLYVLCDDLTGITEPEASALMRKLFAQYRGPRDEVLVYFVKSPGSFGRTQFESSSFVGVYYTHDNSLIIWPEIEAKRESFAIEWE